MKEEQSKPIKFIVKEDGQEKSQSVEVPLQGNLALLAFGDIGLMAWRKKKADFLKAVQEKNDSNSEA